MAARAKTSEVHGILAVEKPAGWTSHDVVARVRRLVGQRSVGHAGTLDPMATGLLPLGLGQATRLLEYLTDGRKRYEATVRFGAATDTYDAEGRETEAADWGHLDRGSVEAALAGFVGEIAQRPPPYSAIKRGGEPLYRLARRGERVEVPPRLVTVYSIAIRRFAMPDLELSVDCGSGTYVRSLANDLGLALGTRAHLTGLRRTRVGRLGVEEATPIAALTEREDVLASLLALDLPVWTLPAVILEGSHARDVREGRRVPAQEAGDAFCRAYGSDGTFLALLRLDPVTENWQPHKVFARTVDASAATD